MFYRAPFHLFRDAAFDAAAAFRKLRQPGHPALLPSGLSSCALRQVDRRRDSVPVLVLVRIVLVIVSFCMLT